MIRKLLIMVLCVFVLCSCQKDDTEHPSDKETTIEGTSMENETSDYVVEDEITLDYSQEQQKDGNAADAPNSLQEPGKSELENNKQQHTGNSTEHTGGTERTDDNETEPPNPYDKDGDGYVDGWY
ncbi:MAG: hypothetical protein IJE60_06785 [Tyzzerella sp.]|nr:hypothetical protein [Tyzzerella sp.]